MCNLIFMLQLLSSAQFACEYAYVAKNNAYLKEIHCALSERTVAMMLMARYLKFDGNLIAGKMCVEVARC